jgi:3-methyl-2-oxobutanoate hydroxymethyltransferase
MLAFGGFKVQGKTREALDLLISDAKAISNEGVYALVLEGVPSLVGTEVTRNVDIPVIGIGAGPDTDGQVLVFHDILGMGNRTPAKFVRQYANVGDIITQAIADYAKDVRSGAFPSAAESYANPEALEN